MTGASSKRSSSQARSSRRFGHASTIFLMPRASMLVHQLTFRLSRLGQDCAMRRAIEFVTVGRPERFRWSKVGLRMMRNWREARERAQPSRVAVRRLRGAFHMAGVRQSFVSCMQPLGRGGVVSRGWIREGYLGLGIP